MELPPRSSVFDQSALSLIQSRSAPGPAIFFSRNLLARRNKKLVHKTKNPPASNSLAVGLERTL
jgi:hypothetical protein